MDYKLVSELQGGSAIAPQVEEFAQAVCNKIRGYKYAYRDGRTTWIYRDGDTFTMGYVGFGDFMDSADGAKRYGVFSPNIQNGKYGYGDRQNMSQATKMAKALNNAAKYLRPLTMKEVVSMTERGVREKAREAVQSVRKNVANIKDEVVDGLFYIPDRVTALKTNALQAELKHLVDTGYEFIDPRVGEQLRKVFGALEELSESRSTNEPVFTIVEAIKSVTGAQKFRVMKDVQLSWNWSHQEIEMDIFSQDELPEELARKLAVMSMVDKDQYVEGVGYKYCDTLYYVR